MVAATRSREEILAELRELRRELAVVEGVPVTAEATSPGERPPGGEACRILVESMNEGAAILDGESVLVYSNTRLAEMLQLPLEEIVGSPFTDYILPEDAPVLEAVLEHAPQGCCTDEITLVTETGRRLPVRIACCPVDLEGERRMSLVVTDLSAQKRNDELLKEQRLASSILYQAGEAIVVCDRGGRIIRASRVALQLSKNSLLRHFDDAFPIVFAVNGEPFPIDAPLNGQRVATEEVLFRRQDGRVFNMVLNARPLRDRHREVTGCVITLTDISERKRVEEELRRSEERFRFIADTLPAFVWTARPDGAIDYVNRRFLDYTGLPPGQEVYAFPFHPDDRDHTQAVWEEALKRREPYQMEHRVRRFDDVYRWYLCRSTPMLDAGGGISKWYGTSTDINDLRETQEQLRQSEAKFRWLFESNLVPALFWNTGGEITEANEAFCNLIGCTVAEVSAGGVRIQDMTPEELHARDLEAWEEVLATGACRPYEKQLVNRLDGHRVTVLIAGAFLIGSRTTGIGFAVDLSGQKEMENALRNSETTLKLAIESTDLGTFDYYPRSGELLWSEVTRRQLGVSPEIRVDYGLFLSCLHPEDRPRVEANLDRVLRGLNGNDYRGEYRVIGHDDGIVRWLAARGKPVYDDQGRVIRLIGTTLDITERKRVEEELRLATEDLEKRVAARTEELARMVATLQQEVVDRLAAEGSLRKSETLLKTVLDTLPVAVWVLDGKGEVATANPAGREMWVEALRQGDQPYKGWWHESGEPIRPGEWGGWRAVATGQATLGVVYDIECFDGGRKTILYSAVPLKDERDQIIGAVVVNEDITERIRNEQALKSEAAVRLQAMEELRRKDRLLMQQSRLAAMGEMIGNIAHQWRQPLNTLGLIIQGMALEHETGSVTKEMMEMSSAKAMQVIAHMSRTIDDFRNFFRPDKEKLPFLVNEVVEKTVSLVDASFRTLQLAIAVSAPEPTMVYGYANEYAQVLLNILLNARDAFIERKVPEPRVEIRLFREDGKAVMVVTDNAGGIDEEIIDRVFDPYFTTKGPDKGTGIGLFMAKTIIEKNMNGALTVRNTGTGAEFRIEIAEHRE